jgi:hypothetical protein
VLIEPCLVSVAGVGWRVGGAGWAAQSRLGHLAADRTLPGERGWCRAESRGTGWARLPEAWLVSC